MGGVTRRVDHMVHGQVSPHADVGPVSVLLDQRAILLTKRLIINQLGRVSRLSSLGSQQLQ